MSRRLRVAPVERRGSIAATPPWKAATSSSWTRTTDCSPASTPPGRERRGKAVGLEKLRALRRPERTLVVYHHQTRRKGGHAAEIAHWADRLRDVGFDRVDALRSGAFSPRALFLLDADEELRDRAVAFARMWNPHVRWFGDGAEVAAHAMDRVRSEDGKHDMTAEEIIDGLREWASTMAPGLKEGELHSQACDVLQEMGVAPKSKHPLLNGELGRSEIDVYVPYAEPPHLLVEFKTTGDWRRVAEATWQLFQASALLKEPTRRVAIFGKPFEDTNLRVFLEKNDVIPIEMGDNVLSGATHAP